MSTRTETFELGTDPIRLEVRLAKADLHVVRGDDQTAVVELSGRDPDRVRVELGGTTLVVAEESSRFRASVDAVTVRVPAGTSLDVTLGVGELDCDAPVDQVRLRTASGDVRIAESTGRVEAKTASGDLRLDRAHGDVTVTTASGDVRLGHVGGRCACTSASGDVHIAVADDDLSVRTASGDVRVGHFAGRAFQSSSMSGDVAIDVAPGRRVRYQFDSLTGEVRTRGGKSEASPDARTIEIEARSMSGDLSLGVSELDVSR